VKSNDVDVADDQEEDETVIMTRELRSATPTRARRPPTRRPTKPPTCKAISATCSSASQCCSKKCVSGRCARASRELDVGEEAK